MCSWKHCLLGLLLLTALTAFLLHWIPVPPSGVRPSSPQEIEEVVAIARQLGLQCRGDREDGQVQMRLLVSQSPLSWEFASYIFRPTMCSMGSSGYRIARMTAHVRSIDTDFQNGKESRLFWRPAPGQSSSGPHGSMDLSARIL